YPIQRCRGRSVQFVLNAVPVRIALNVAPMRVAHRQLQVSCRAICEAGVFRRKPLPRCGEQTCDGFEHRWHPAALAFWAWHPDPEILQALRRQSAIARTVISERAL